MEAKTQPTTTDTNVGRAERKPRTAPNSTMAIVDRGLLEQNEIHLHFFVVDASELQWKPGEWPQRFFVSPRFGNDRPFWINRVVKDHAGEDAGYVYRQEFGCIEVHVLND